MIRQTVLSFLLLSTTVFGNEINQNTAEISYDFESEEKSEGQRSFFGVERIFKNPTLLSGLNNSADSINRSVDSLMEALFYSLLDNQIFFDITDDSNFSWQLKRDLFSTNSNSYVVVDRFSLGPQILTNLSSIQNIPIDFAADSSVNVMNIYLRNDGMRLAEDNSNSIWGKLIKNWFGILPLLTRLLPPSFNPNELYDPLKILETPLYFPFSVSTFKKMPVGSIRSYSLNSGIRLPIDVLSGLGEKITTASFGIPGVSSVLPLSLFKTGENRLNILRRSLMTAWVGLTHIEKLGHGLNLSAGRSYSIFAKISPLWSGIPAPIFPIDISIDRANVVKQDFLFEFDLNNIHAIRGYEKAALGNFDLAYELHKKRIDEEVDTGVTFHFQRTISGLEKNFQSNHNLYVYRTNRENRTSESEIEINDEKGQMLLLQSKLESNRKEWNVLVGSRDLDLSAVAKIDVKKNSPNTQQKYEFLTNLRGEHTTLTFNLNINDLYIDTHEFNETIRFVEDIFNVDFQMTALPTYDSEEIRENQKKLALANPIEDIYLHNVSPIYLGKFNINASAFFSHKSIEQAAYAANTLALPTLLESFGLNENHWFYPSEITNPSFFEKTIYWSLYPLKMLNFYDEKFDAHKTALETIDSLKSIRESLTPSQRISAFTSLFKTAYPERLLKSLIHLVSAKVPRKIKFFTTKKGKETAAHETFSQLNSTSFEVDKFPRPKRERIANEKLEAFVPKERSNSASAPKITRISIANKSSSKINSSNKDIYVSIQGKGLHPQRQARVYVKFEQAGKVNVGRFVLAEEVLNLSPDRKGTFAFFLTGPKSPFNDFVFTNAFTLISSYKLTLGISPDGKIWSPNQTALFRIENGKLLPTEKN